MVFALFVFMVSGVPAWADTLITYTFIGDARGGSPVLGDFRIDSSIDRLYSISITSEAVSPFPDITFTVPIGYFVGNGTTARYSQIAGKDDTGTYGVFLAFDPPIPQGLSDSASLAIDSRGGGPLSIIDEFSGADFVTLTGSVVVSSVTTIPEPRTTAIFSVGLLVLLGVRRLTLIWPDGNQVKS
jgi:hypothetical protein